MNASREKNTIALKLVVTGLVQGVGFRPFISRLALKHKLGGYVKNIGGSEVELWIEGNEADVYEFLYSLFIDKPPVAILDQVFASKETPQGFTAFNIEKSSTNVLTRSNIPPDFAICKDCLTEVLTSGDRRYLYAFNSCAWCGPRFSMMYKTPYDRENTAMFKYVLCDECIHEYNDPDNLRRHHAQGISCPRDGPKLLLLDKNFNEVSCENPVTEAARLIEEGYIVGVKGIGGYHIAALATNDDTVIELRKRKKRPRKPFAIMGLNTEVLKKLVYMDPDDEALLNSPQAPILILPKRPETPVSKYVSPDLSHEGVFIAYSALHYLLLMNTKDKFLIMTSGNTHGEPMCIDEECAKNKLSKIVDYFLVHDREIVNRVDDSVLRKTGNSYLFLRRSRGYAPAWITINKDLGGEFIAFGGDLSNVGGVGFENKIALTPYVGDLESLQAQKDLLKYVDFLVKNYHIGKSSKPIVVVDLHPQMHSRSLGVKYAEMYSFPWIQVQHHYAHVLGAAIDNELDGTIAGLAIDGLGWGLDKTIWGGEVLIFRTDSRGFKRTGSISQLPLTSDRDTLKPIRLLFAYYSRRGFDFAEIMKLAKAENSLLECKSAFTLVRNGRYVPASSTGRLIDLVTAILNPTVERTYEGEPAIWLESIAFKGEQLILDDFRILYEDGILRLNYDDVIDWIIENKSRYRADTLARSFLYSLGYWLGELVVESIKGSRVDNVVISGGAAVNEFIYRGLRDKLFEVNLTLHLPRRIPPGDGGLAFGQIIAASLNYMDS
ncbi:MAG: carbamoyltransferase HypF [Desulfurococcaceae archaeon]